MNPDANRGDATQLPQASPATFNLRTIGPEPDGATPIDDDDLADLIPDFVATRGDLNGVEYENIAKAMPWAQAQARRGGVLLVLSYSFVIDLHRRMFEDVWKWAGTHADAIRISASTPRRSRLR